MIDGGGDVPCSGPCGGCADESALLRIERISELLEFVQLGLDGRLFTGKPFLVLSGFALGIKLPGADSGLLLLLVSSLLFQGEHKVWLRCGRP